MSASRTRRAEAAARPPLRGHPRDDRRRAARLLRERRQHRTPVRFERRRARRLLIGVSGRIRKSATTPTCAISSSASRLKIAIAAIAALRRRSGALLAYLVRLKERKVADSMSRPANPRDNAKAESFMKTLKHAEVNAKSKRRPQAASLICAGLG